MGGIMSNLGKIVLVGKEKNPHIIISEERLLRGLGLIKSYDEKTCFKLVQGDIKKIDYRGKKLDDCSAYLGKCYNIHNLQIKEIGLLNEKTYYRLLRSFVSYQASQGADDWSYLLVRTEVHNQLIKAMDRGISLF